MKCAVLFTAVVALLICICSFCRAQEEGEDVLYLKSGKVVRGQILEIVPNKEIRIKTSDGKTKIYEMSAVQDIRKKSASDEEMRNTRSEGNEVKGLKRRIIIQPYVRAGYLLVAPSQEDLKYEGRGSNVSFSMSKTNYGLGAQLLFPLDWRISESFISSWGIDFGFQTLFSSVLVLDNSPLTITTYDDRESAVHLLALANLAHRSLPIDLQTGAGLYFVFWRHDLHSAASQWGAGKTESFSSMDVEFGFLVSGGYNLQVTKDIQMVLMLRLDNIVRYGLTTTASGVAAIKLDI